MRAVSGEEPSRLVKSLAGAILASGGWVLSRSTSDSGLVSMLFEFERRDCMDLYTTLVAAGLELSQTSHTRITELCQCTRHQPACEGENIVSVELLVQTYPMENWQGSVVPQAA